MKNLKINTFLTALFLAATAITLNAQTMVEEAMSEEVPGDNFSLEGALELFKKSDSPEAFERMLNSQNSKVNNLDLNKDGRIDYIRIVDIEDGNIHAFVIQAVISETESQDVAVIELEKLEDGKALLQITGDADVYGIETIIEPTEQVRVNAGASTAQAPVNVWAWPSVQYVYNPYYTVWVSPYRWSYLPVWWRPWSPISFTFYASWWRPYRPYYSICHTHRIGYMPYFYNPYRTTSVIVYNNHRNQIDHYRSRNDNGRYSSNNGRSNGRERNDGNVPRSDYQGRGNRETGRRYEANANETRNRYLSGRTGRTTTPSDLTMPRSRSNSERSYSPSTDFDRSPRTQLQRPSFQQAPAPQRGSQSQFQQPRQSNSSLNKIQGQRMSQGQQRPSASPSVRSSSGRSMPSSPSRGGSTRGGDGKSVRTRR